MKKTLEQLAGIIGCSTVTIRILLCRAEFSHIHRIWNVKKRHYELDCIKPIDISRLSALFHSKKRKKQ